MSRKTNKLRAQLKKLALLLGVAQGELSMAKAEVRRMDTEVRRWRPLVRVIDEEKFEALRLDLLLPYDLLKYAVDPRAIVNNAIEDMRSQVLTALREKKVGIPWASSR